MLLPPNKSFTLILDYPTEIVFEKTISTGKCGLTRKQLVSKIINAYKELYQPKNATEFGVWRHVLSDLMLSVVHIKGNKLTVGVDS
jgi:hypothetical protein